MTDQIMPTGYRVGAILLGILATILIVLGVATFYGYWPTTLTNNLTAQQLGVLGAISIVGAAGLEYINEYHGRGK